MFRKVISSTLCLTILLGMCAISASATSDHQNIDVLENNSMQNYRIDFVDGLSYNSDTMKDNLQTIADNLIEIVFTVDAGEDEFTIGYFLGNKEYSFELLSQEIEDAVFDTNYDIANEPRLSSNKSFEPSDLELKYVEVKTPSISSTNSISSTVNDKFLELSGVKSVTPLLSKSETITSSASPQISTQRSDIDGSYHFYDIIHDQEWRCWYNQFTGQTSACPSSAISPHAGDGNSRYAAGYQWFPDEVEAAFYTNYSADENRTQLWYKYDSDTLDNLNYDSDEALEMEVIFYNYSDDSYVYEERGNAFQLMENGATWRTNQPNSYRDTTVGDDKTEVSLCVGVDDTSDLESGKWYYWYIDSEKGDNSNNYPNDGRFRVVAQRGYSVLLGGAFGVFSEEHEPICRLGITSSNNWVSQDENAWECAKNGDTWTFDSASDPVS